MKKAGKVKVTWMYIAPIAKPLRRSGIMDYTVLPANSAMLVRVHQMAPPPIVDADIYCSLLSVPKGWLNCSVRFTHTSGHPLAGIFLENED